MSALPTVSRVFERIKNNVAKITVYIGKGFGTQDTLLALIVRWKLCLNKQVLLELY